MYLPHRITCMGPVNIRRARPMAALGIGMANGEIRIYNEKALVRTAWGCTWLGVFACNGARV